MDKPVSSASSRYLKLVPDDTVMNRQVFLQLLRENRKARKYGFSKKHTAEIEEIRKRHGEPSLPSNLYDLPVEWNAEFTYLAKW